jgi:hypothetical protein
VGVIGWFARLFSPKGTRACTLLGASHDVILPFVDSVRLLQPHARRLDAIWDRMRLSEASRACLFDEPVRRFAEFVLNLPASRAHHDSAPGGLLDHTISTLDQATRQDSGEVRVEPEKDGNPLAARYPDRIRRHRIFLGALLHDLGKVFSVRVTCFHPTLRLDLSIRPWNPLEESLEAYLTRHQARQFCADYARGFEREQHEAMGALLFGRIVPPPSSSESGGRQLSPC